MVVVFILGWAYCCSRPRSGGGESTSDHTYIRTTWNVERVREISLCYPSFFLQKNKNVEIPIINGWKSDWKERKCVKRKLALKCKEMPLRRKYCKIVISMLNYGSFKEFLTTIKLHTTFKFIKKFTINCIILRTYIGHVGHCSALIVMRCNVPRI